MAPKHPAPKGPKLIHGYTPLIGPEARQSTMGKRRMFSASTSVFYTLPHPQIRLLPSSFFQKMQLLYMSRYICHLSQSASWQILQPYHICRTISDTVVNTAGMSLRCTGGTALSARARGRRPADGVAQPGPDLSTHLWTLWWLKSEVLSAAYVLAR